MELTKIIRERRQRTGCNRPFRPQGQVESLLIGVARDPAKAFSETLSIAVIAAGADFPCNRLQDST